MLKPQIAQLLSECKSPYSLVVAVARRSRDIAAKALEDKMVLDEKPVNIAIDEFGAHKYRAVEHNAQEE